MRIALNNLGSDKLDLDLGNDRIVALSELRGLGGTVERDGAVLQLRGLGAAGAVLQQLSMPLPTGKLATNKPATLENLEANVDVRATKDPSVPAFAGVITAGGLNGTVVSLELAVGERTLKITGDLGASAISATIEQGKGEVHVASLDLRNVQLMFDGAIVRIDRLAASNLHVGWGGEVTVSVASAELSNSHVRREGTDLKLATLSLPSGFTLANKQIRIDALNADSIETILANLIRDKSAESESAAAPQPAPATAPAKKIVDLGVLDRLNGHVNVDVTLVAVVPVIGTRDATHKFRIPVNDGIINYAELEDDLSGLEDAFIDFTVRGERLVIERDVPIIPGLNKPIVIWDLEPPELALAKRKLVRLRTLPSARLAGSSEDDGKSSFVLKRLRVGNIDVSLGVVGPEAPEEEQTALRELSVGSLVVAGLIDHMPKAQLEATPIEVSAEQLAATINELVLGKLQLDVRVHVGAITGATVTMAGFKPSGLAGNIHDLRISDLLLTLP